MIPKRIFYVWSSYQDKGKDILACIQTWRQTCPSYEIIEINEKSTRYFHFKNELKNNKWFRTVYKLKMWAYVSDFIRIKTLYLNGGIYLDTDVSILKSFDPFLNDEAFVGMQGNLTETSADIVEPAILGAQKGNPFLKKVLSFYDNDIWSFPIYSMPQIFQFFLKKENCPPFNIKKQQKIIPLKNITIYPERFFVPCRFNEKFSPACIEEQTYAIHWFSSSWLNHDTLLFLKNKHHPDFLKELKRNYHKKTFKIRLFFKIPLSIKIKTIGNKTTLFFISLPIYTQITNHFHFDHVIEKKIFICGFPMLKIKSTPIKIQINFLFFIPFISVKRQ